MDDPSAGSDQGGRIVLLIDEDPRTGRLVRLTLSGTGFQVLGCTRHQEGLALLERYRPGLVLMERRFEAVDGRQLVERVLQAASGFPCRVVILSDDAPVSERLRLLRAGAVDYVAKTEDLRALGARLKVMLSRVIEGEEPSRTGPALDRIIQQAEQLEASGASGVLALSRAGEAARLGFEDGRLVTCEYGDHRGEAALLAAVGTGDWELSFDEGQVLTESPAPEPEVVPANRVAAPGERQPGPDDDGHFREVPPELIRTHTGQTPDGVTPVTDANGLPGFDELPEDTATDLEGMDELEARGSTSQEQDLPAPGEVQERARRTAAEDGPVPARNPGRAPEPAPDPAQLFDRWPRGAGSPQPALRPPAAAELQNWRERIHGGPLLLVIPQPVLRETLQAAAGERGLPVINAASGRDAFTLAHQYRPLAVIADEQLPDISGRDLLASLRCDFVVRETPVVLVSGPQLSSALAAGPAGLAPVLEAMESALGPRVELLQRLLAGEAARVPGWVEPVGVANLLRSIGAAGLTGYLLLRHGEHRNAVVSFGQGAICAVAVNSPQSADGPLAMLHLLGYEWHEYFFSPAPELAAAQPMGPLEALVETACRQNNVLLSRLYLEGIRREDQLLNYPAMDLYMSQLNQRSLGLFMQLGEGTPAADMAASGEAGAAALKALLFEMRRKAVIRPGALKQVRMEPVTLEIPPVSEAPPLPAAPPQPERVTGPQLPPKDSVPRHPPTPASVPRAAAGGSGLPRWLVALLAAAVTLTLAAGGYFIYLRLVGG